MKTILCIVTLLFTQAALAEVCFDRDQNVQVTIAHDSREIWAIEIRENNRLVLVDRGHDQFGFGSSFCKADGVEHFGSQTRFGGCHAPGTPAVRILRVENGPTYDLAKFECTGEPVEE